MGRFWTSFDGLLLSCRTTKEDRSVLSGRNGSESGPECHHELSDRFVGEEYEYLESTVSNIVSELLVMVCLTARVSFENALNKQT